MALKINTESPHWPEIREILHQWSDHAKICEVCDVKTGKTCGVGLLILKELTRFGDDVQEVPEDYGDKHGYKKL